MTNQTVCTAVPFNMKIRCYILTKYSLNECNVVNEIGNDGFESWASSAMFTTNVISDDAAMFTNCV